MRAFPGTNRNGANVTPGSALRQAILAVLLVAPSQSRARRTLQDMFWGSSTTERSSANLRTALYLLKRDLLPLGEDCLRADRHSVSLAPGRIALGHGGVAGQSFLEGLDLPLADCEEFEDWLRQMRTRDGGDGLADDAPDAPFWLNRRISRMALGLLASHHAGLPATDLISADGIVDGIARFVARVADVDIHDLRGRVDFAFPLPIDSGVGATHLLQAVIERRGQSLLTHLRLREVSSRRIIWVSEPLDSLSDFREELVCSCAETLLQQMAANPAEGDPTDLFPWTALTGLFSLNDDLIMRTEAKVAVLAAEGRLPVFECLRLFAQVFKANEGVAQPESTSSEHICEMLSAIPDAHPMLPLALSLAGYSAHMLIGENELAAALIKRAEELAPNLALNLDHLAVIRLMQGDLEGAEAAFRRCLRSGASSPWRYTYDVSGAMIAMARGDVRQALAFANQALMRKPRFVGALRYAMLGFALSENGQDARRMQARIRVLRPGYDFGGWTEAMVRRTPPHLGGRLAQIMQSTRIV